MEGLARDKEWSQLIGSSFNILPLKFKTCVVFLDAHKCSLISPPKNEGMLPNCQCIEP